MSGPDTGVVTYNGPSSLPECFTVHWESGDVTHHTWRELRPMLARATVVVSAMAIPGQKVEKIDYTSVEGLATALNRLMPGAWDSRWVARLVNSMPGGVNSLQHPGQPRPGEPECCETLEAEVQPLIRLIDFTRVPVIVDPFSGTGTVARVFGQQPGPESHHQ